VTDHGSWTCPFSPEERTVTLYRTVSEQFAAPNADRRVRTALIFAWRIAGRQACPVSPYMKPDLLEVEASAVSQAVEVECHPDPRTRMEKLIGLTLLVGVLASTFVVLFGGVIYVSRYASVTVDYRVFRGEPSDLRS
jgi:hypothetical protein